jgi:secreted Zn-dependent insulinase-like peptidase
MMSAAATVNIGAAADPRNLSELAHFCGKKIE